MPRRALLWSPIVVLGLVGRAGAQPCASPMTPGSWSGKVDITITGDGVSPTSDRIHRFVRVLSQTVSGTLSLRVACDGSVMGTLAPVRMKLDLTYTGTNLKSGRSARIATTECNGASTVAITSGKVAAGAGGLPLLTLNGTVKLESFGCAGEVASAIDSQYAGSGGSQGYEATFTAQAAAASATVVSGSSWESSDRDITSAYAGLARLGIVPATTKRWQLQLVAAAGTPTPPRPAADPPIITTLKAQYIQNFLQGVKRVPNQFTAEVDWNGGEPGRVVFRLGAAEPVPVTGASPYTFTAEMGDLPGSAVLDVVAINSEGTASAPRQLGVTIVPVPAWARDIAWAAQLKSGYVLYAGQKRFPQQPASFSFNVPDWIPYVGGSWGLLPTQFNANLNADSRGQEATAAVTGFGGFGLGSESYDMTFSGSATTLLGSTQLEFLRGKAGLAFTPPFYRARYANLLNYFPGLQGLENIPLIGRYTKDLVTARASVRATLQGEGELTVQNDQLLFKNGRGTVLPQVDLIPLRLGPGWLYVEVRGVANGSVTFDFAPKFKLTTCFLQFRLMVDGSFYDYAPLFQTPSLDYSCRVSPSGEQPAVAAPAPAAVASMATRVPPRPPGWQPPRAVDEPFTTRAGLAGSTLVKGARPSVSPALAVSPTGAAALAYVTEDAAKPRPRASEIMVRLFDGKTWSQPLPVTSDSRPDFNPQVAFDGQGQLVVGWVESRIADLGPESQLDERFLRSLEVAYAVVDGKTGRVVQSGTLTGDAAVKSDLRFARGGDGTVLAVWQVQGWKSQNASLVAASWDGKRWGEPQTAADPRPIASHWSAVAADAKRAVIVEDAGGEVVVHELAGGRWGDARRLARGAAPRAAFTADGRPVVAWFNDGKVVGLVGDLAATPSPWFAATPDTAATLAGGTLVAGPRGDLVLYWSGTTPNGANLLHAAYHPADGKWTEPAPLLDGTDLATDLSAAALAGGGTLLGYARQAADKTVDVQVLGVAP